MKIQLFHAGITKIKKFLEFHARIIQNHENLIIRFKNNEHNEIPNIPLQTHETHKILIIPHQNNENHEIPNNLRQNNENHENEIIPRQKYENHEIHRIPSQIRKSRSPYYLTPE